MDLIGRSHRLSHLTKEEINLTDFEDTEAQISTLTLNLKSLSPPNQPLDNDGIQFFKQKGFNFQEKLGEGAFSDVWNCTYTNSKTGKVTKLACKRITLAQTPQPLFLNAVVSVLIELRACEVMRDNRHPNIVSCDYVKGIFDKESKFTFPIVTLIFMEKCAGNMKEFITQYCGYSIYTSEKFVVKGFKENDLRKVFIQMLNAIDFLHNQPKIYHDDTIQLCITHNDIKPENILYKVHQSKDAFCQFKLTDFGLSELSFEGDSNKSNSKRGTKLYSAPEIFDSERKNYYDMIKSDIFSLEATMLSLATGYCKDIEYLMIRFIDKCLREFNKDEVQYYLKISDELTDLIMNMCNPHPDERMTIKEIYEDKWIKKGQLDYGFVKMEVIQSYNRKLKEKTKLIASVVSTKRIGRKNKTSPKYGMKLPVQHPLNLVRTKNHEIIEPKGKMIPAVKMSQKKNKTKEKEKVEKKDKNKEPSKLTDRISKKKGATEKPIIRPPKELSVKNKEALNKTKESEIKTKELSTKKS